MPQRCQTQQMCIIEMMSKNKESWSPLLSIGHKLCAQQDWEKALKSFEQALQLAEDLSGTSEASAHSIKGAALICIGAMALCRGNSSRAVEYFRRGHEAFLQARDDYGRAVAFFAQGIVYEANKEWREVFRFYERAKVTLSGLGKTAIASQLHIEITERLENSLKEWRRSIGDDPSITSSQTRVEKGVLLGFLPFFSHIPAGDPRPIPETVRGYIETDRVYIGGRQYFVKRTDENIVRLSFSQDVSYIALQVKGDSMELADINDGDYVILRSRSFSGLPLFPQDREIVAVALPPDEENVTLKRFRKYDNKVCFEPESNNPEHKLYTFELIGDVPLAVKIVGIYVATLKPL